MSVPYSARLPVGNRDFTHATVVIIGAGISGICMAIDLIKRNKCRNFVILEKSSSVGGTWHDNKYPGCVCDVSAFLYSYSFEQKADWPREYPSQEEFHAYLIRIAEKWGLYRHIRFNSTVVGARWNVDECSWEVQVQILGLKDREFQSSYAINTEFLVSAVGQLNIPREPNIPGLRDFQGKMMHSARWDWTYDLSEKMIAVIGNGASGAQIAPAVAPAASHLTIFQRTPNWIMPRGDKPISAFQQILFTYFPPLLWRKRALQMEMRDGFHDAIFNNDSEFARMLRELCTNLMKAQLPDSPELWEKLTPNYQLGCKRLLVNDDYYPTLSRENVDLETRPISRITENGIEVTGGGEKKYDLIILATGPKSVKFLSPIQIYGANGRPLSDIWKTAPMAYKGVAVEDLPNFGMLFGPNSNVGHVSTILMIEAQSLYLSALIGEVIQARKSGEKLSLNPTPSAMKSYNDRIQAQLQTSTFADPHCSSWYKTDDGIITNNWSGTAADYQKELSEVQWQHYVAEGPGKDRLLNRKPTWIGRAREERFLSDTSLLFGVVGILAVAASHYLRVGFYS